VIVDRAFPEAIARLSRIGLKEVYQDGIRLVFENASPLPRAFLAAKLVAAASMPWELPDAGSTATTLDQKLIDDAKQVVLRSLPQRLLTRGP